MRKIVGLALAAGAALAAIAPALADPQLSAECLKMDSLRATANSYKLLADTIGASIRKVVAEENKYFARFNAEKTITLSGTVKELQSRAGSEYTIRDFAPPRAVIILKLHVSYPDNSTALTTAGGLISYGPEIPPKPP